jgi:hypothetical protein
VVRATTDDMDRIGPRPLLELLDLRLARCLLASLGLHLLLLGPAWLVPDQWEPWRPGAHELPPQLVRIDEPLRGYLAE